MRRPIAARIDDMINRPVQRIIFDSDKQSLRWDVDDPEVREIRYHSAMDEGDRDFCDVYMTDGTVQRWRVFEALVFAAEEPTT